MAGRGSLQIWMARANVTFDGGRASRRELIAIVSGSRYILGIRESGDFSSYPGFVTVAHLSVPTDDTVGNIRFEIEGGPTLDFIVTHHETSATLNGEGETIIVSNVGQVPIEIWFSQERL